MVHDSLATRDSTTMPIRMYWGTILLAVLSNVSTAALLIRWLVAGVSKRSTTARVSSWFLYNLKLRNKQLLLCSNTLSSRKPALAGYLYFMRALIIPIF